MNEVVAWWKNGENGEYSVWYENPENYGENSEDFIPLYEGWQEIYEEFASNLGPNQTAQCDENGNFYAYDLPENPPEPVQEEPIIPEETDHIWSEIADAVREGINKV